MGKHPELRHLRYFVAVAEELHFGRAAQRLGIQQPPLSQQIQALELAIGAPLLTRKPRVALTQAGEMLVGPARGAIAQADRAVAAARSVANGEGGTLTVGFASSTLGPALGPAIRTLHKRVPGVELRLREMSSGELPDALRNHQIDLGIGRELRAEPQLKVELLLEEGFMAVLPAGHARASEGPIGLAALRDEPFVHFYRATAPELHDRVAALCRGAGFAPRVVQEAHEWFTIIGLVETGVGVTLVPESFKRIRWSGVTYAALRAPRNRSTSIVLCRRTDDRSPLAELFASILRRRTAPTVGRGGAC